MEKLKFIRHKIPVKIRSPMYRKAVVAGSVVKVVSMREAPGDFPIRKIDKQFYVDVRTGQLGEYHRSETKADLSTDSLRKTLERLRLIINANCVSASALRWLTLTYAENMRDRKRLYTDFNRFFVRFKRYSVKNCFEIPEYIAVAEPQNRGAWHLHVILVYPYVAPFVPVSDLQEMWGQGFTWITKCEGVDNIGAYFSAYLSDLPLDEAQDCGVSYSSASVVEKEVYEFERERRAKKKFVKGARLSLYPAGMNLYRCSRGIVKPLAVDCSGLSPEEWENEKAGWGEPTFARSCSVIGLSPGGCPAEVNIVSSEYYNRKQV